jgi:hypothetical protein
MVTMSVEPHLAKYVAILRDIRSMLVTDELRQAMMAAIYEEFSERNLATVLAAGLDEDQHLMLAEAIGAHSRLGNSSAAMEMRRLLAERGWDFDDNGPPT